MVTIRFKMTRNSVKIDAKGHALFDKKGKDVVCAAVSVLLQSWFVGEKELCEASVETKTEDGHFSAQMGNYGEKEKLLLDNLILSLKVLQNQYSDHIKVTVEETNGRR
jgi:uncharacterized protein